MTDRNKKDARQDRNLIIFGAVAALLGLIGSFLIVLENWL